MLKLSNLSVGYGHRAVISDINTVLSPGGVYGLLGSNGCGKTTLMKTIAGGIEPVHGNIYASDCIPFQKHKEFLKSMVYMPEDFRLPGCSVEKFIKLYGKNRPQFSVQDFYDNLCSLNFHSNERIDRLSLGNKKKLFIAYSLACHPKLLLMDEPTNGLDMEAKKSFSKLMVTTDFSDSIVIISTHLLPDLRNLLSGVIIVCDGKIALDLSIDKIASLLQFNNGENESLLYSDGLNTVSANVDGEYTDVDIELLYYAVRESNTVREYLNKNTNHD